MWHGGQDAAAVAFRAEHMPCLARLQPREVFAVITQETGTVRPLALTQVLPGPAQKFRPRRPAAPQVCSLEGAEGIAAEPGRGTV